MVGVQNEEHVERLLQARVGLVLGLGHLEEHAEEVAWVGEVVVGVDVGQPETVAVGEGGEGRHLGYEAHRRHVPLVLVVYVLRLRVEGRERANRSLQHPHRVGVVAEAVHEVLDVLVDVGVVRDLVDPLVQLVLGRKLTVVQEVSHLEVGGVLAQLLDGDAPMLEDALLPVYVRDGAPTTRRVRVTGVVGHQAEVVLVDLDLPEIHRPDSAVLDLDVVALSRPIVLDRKALDARGSRTLAVARALRLFAQLCPFLLHAR